MAAASKPWAALKTVLERVLARLDHLEAAAGPAIGDTSHPHLHAEDLHRIKARQLTIGGAVVTVLTLEE